MERCCGVQGRVWAQKAEACRGVRPARQGRGEPWGGSVHLLPGSGGEEHSPLLFCLRRSQIHRRRQGSSPRGLVAVVLCENVSIMQCLEKE